MTSDTLLPTLEQNRTNLKALLDAIDADYKMAEDREKKAELAASMGLSSPSEKDEISEEERVAWLFAENAKALAAAAEEAGARTAEAPAIVRERDGLDSLADAMGGR